MAIFLGALFIVICILLIIVVLLQKGRGGGLAAAFGGAGSSAFGARTGDVFTWVTIVLTALFLILAIGATFAFRPRVETAANPEFRPPAGAVPSPTPVEILCATPSADIRFTTDGTDPTRNSRKYNVRIEITPPVTLKARAYRRGMNDSEIAVADYTLAEVEKPVPETKPAEPGAETQPTEPATKPATMPQTRPAAEAGAVPAPGL